MLPDLPQITLADLGYGWADVRIWIGVATTLAVVIAIAVSPRKQKLTR